MRSLILKLQSPAFRAAATELVWISSPIVIWLLWLTVTGKLNGLAKKPEISFISVILSAEALRSRFASRKTHSTSEENSVALLTILLVMCVLCLGLDIGQYENQWANEVAVANIIVAKFAILLVSAIGFLWVKYQHRVHSSSVQALETTTYPPDMSVMFYSAIAPTYDARNSLSLRQVQLRVALALREHRASKANLPFSVLDLGGGTGRLIAEHFIHDDALGWTLVDASSEMIAAAANNFSGSRLKMMAVNCDILKPVELAQKLGSQKI